MKETSTEKRLELSVIHESNKGATETKNGAASHRSSFQLRFLVAVILLSCAILIDKSGINLAGITRETIARVISADYEEYLEEWVSTMAE